ncbi:hypothetical protein [Sediminitomix flava]|nr:hypothetical protein [Sediminitomix flava]
MEKSIRRDVSMSLSIEFQAGFKQLSRNIRSGKDEISDLINQIPSNENDVAINLKTVTDQVILTRKAYQSFMNQHAS